MGADKNRNARGRKHGQGDPPLFRAPLERTSSVTTSDTQDRDTPFPEGGEGGALQDVGGLRVTDQVFSLPAAEVRLHKTEARGAGAGRGRGAESSGLPSLPGALNPEASLIVENPT